MKYFFMLFFVFTTTFIFAQKTQKVVIEQLSQVETLKSGCLGLSVKYFLKFTYSANEIVPDSLKDANNEKTLKFEALVNLKKADTKINLSKHKFSVEFILLNLEKTKLVEIFIPYAYLNLQKGEYLVFPEVNILSGAKKIGTAENKATNINIPQKIKVNYAVKNINVVGSDWDIMNPFSSNSEYADVYLVFQLAGESFFTSPVKYNSSTLNGKFQTGEIEICVSDEIAVSIYDEDTIYHDLINTLSIKPTFKNPDWEKIKLSHSDFELKKTLLK